MTTTVAQMRQKLFLFIPQAGIIHKVTSPDAPSPSAGALCSDLESMLLVCSRETELLGRCKGRQHAATMERLHLSATADILAHLGKGELF